MSFSKIGAKLASRSSAYRLLANAGVPKAWRAIDARGATILTYHGFTDMPSFEGVIDHQRMRLHVDAFRQHVEHLVANYRVVSLSSLVSLFRAGREAPEHAVAITFDDGYRSTYTLAHPVLKEYGVPATLFVASDFVYERRALWHDRVEHAVNETREIEIELDGEVRRLSCATVDEKLAALRVLYGAMKRVDQDHRDALVDDVERRAGVRLDVSRHASEPYSPIDVSELRDMAGVGLVEVGCHTKTHAVLSRCGPERLKAEILRSKERIEGSLSRSCDLFCYPNGRAEDFNAETRAELVAAGFACALTTIPGKNEADTDLMELRRISAPSDLAEFSLAVSGARLGFARAYHAAQKFLGRSTVGADAA
jgi:peptidoglycan/xylan/chitin deacetylase (PgdA/CDA1 family)